MAIQAVPVPGVVEAGAAPQHGWGSRPRVCSERMRRVVVPAAAARSSMVSVVASCRPLDNDNSFSCNIKLCHNER